MKNIGILLCLLLALSGCATYKFQKGQKPFEKGYVVARDGYTIIEYTVGKDNSVPVLEVAKERFQRRKTTVEDYYEKMGSIESRLKQYFWNPPATLVEFIAGFFRLPFIAVSNYKYEHNPEYRAKMIQMEEEKDAKERAQRNSLKVALREYVQKDLAQETPEPEKPILAQVPTAPEPQPEPQEVIHKEEKAVIPEAQPQVIAEMPEAPLEVKPEARDLKLEEALRENETPPPILSKGPAVVIVAHPQKGFSPLTVKFSERTRSPYGKIISYFWEFGDGDTSTKRNPVNTYWSASYGSRKFTATLTVKDSQGNTSTANAVIEVMSR